MKHLSGTVSDLGSDGIVKISGALRELLADVFALYRKLPRRSPPLCDASLGEEDLRHLDMAGHSDTPVSLQGLAE
jgi:hypothetical protein